MYFTYIYVYTGAATGHEVHCRQCTCLCIYTYLKIYIFMYMYIFVSTYTPIYLCI